MAEGVQLIGTVVGGALGGPVGAAIGGAVGGLVGAALFPPPPIRGPRIDEFRLNNSTIGAPMARMYGSGRKAGTLIWVGEVEEVERTRREGGLFGIGGTKITEYEYYATFAMALGEPAGAAGVDVRRIWANGTLIYSTNELTAAQLAELENYLELQRYGQFIQSLYGPSRYLAASAAAQRFEDEVITIYRGTEDQAPDPTIQSYLGVDSTPGFAGVAYVVFKRWDITQWGGALPNIEFEYVNGPSGAIMSPEWRNERLYPWSFDGTDPRNCLNQHEFENATGQGTGVPRDSLNEAIADASAGIGYPILGTILGYSIDTANTGGVLPHRQPSIDTEARDLFLHLNTQENRATTFTTKVTGSPCALAFEATRDTIGLPAWGQRTTTPDGTWTAAIYQAHLSPGGGVYEPPLPPERNFFASNCLEFSDNQFPSSPVVAVSQCPDRLIRVTRVPRCPPDPCDTTCTTRRTLALPEDERYCVDADTGEVLFSSSYTRYDSASYAILCHYAQLGFPASYEEPAVPAGDERYPVTFTEDVAREFWDEIWRDAGERGYLPAGWEDWVYGVDYPLIVAAPSFRVLQFYAQSGGSVLRYPLDPCVPSWSPNYDSAAFWDAAYERQRALYAQTGHAQDFIPAGLSFGAGYPVAQNWACARFPPAMRRKEALPVTVAEIVADVSAEVGVPPAQIDVTQLTKTLIGYERDRVMAGRDAIEQLRLYQFFDACESGTQIRFVRRGGAVAAAVPADALGAYVDGDAPPPAMTPARINDVELPQLVRVNYPEASASYQGNTQESARITSGEQGVMEVTLAIASDALTMKGVADALMFDRWAARNSYQTALLREWLALEPTDAITVPVDHQLVRMRITQIDHDPRGVLGVRAVREDASVYVPSGVGGVALPPPGEDVHPVLGPTLLTVIDGPALTESDDDAGVFVAARGISAAWPGAVLYASDDGANYAPVLSLNSAGLGNVQGVLGEGPHHLWDRANTLTVRVPSSVSLLSADEAAVLGGTNRAFVGGDGRWELIGWATATLQSDDGGFRVYALQDLLRGLKGTEWARTLHADGDVFTLTQTLARLAAPTEALGVQMQFKAVTAGTAIDKATPIAVTLNGVALKPYAVCDIRGFRRPGAGVLVQWKRRTRINGEWRDSVDVPLNEAEERYDYEATREDTGALIASGSVTEPQVLLPAYVDVARLFPEADLFIRAGAVLYAVGLGYRGLHAYDASTYAHLGWAQIQNLIPQNTVIFSVEGSDAYVVSRVQGDAENAPAAYRVPLSDIQNSIADYPSSGPISGWGAVQGGTSLGDYLYISGVTDDPGTVPRVQKINKTTLADAGNLDNTAWGAAIASGMSNDGTNLYLIVRGNTSTLYKLQPDGTEIWSVPLDRFAVECLYAAGNVWVLSTETLSVYDASDGTLLRSHLLAWRAADGRGLIGPAVFPNHEIRLGNGLVFGTARESSTGPLEGFAPPGVDVDTDRWGWHAFDTATLELSIEYYGLHFYGGTNETDLLMYRRSVDSAAGVGASTVAQRPADYSGTVRVTVYQISAAVGRGYPASALV